MVWYQLSPSGIGVVINTTLPAGNRFALREVATTGLTVFTVSDSGDVEMASTPAAVQAAGPGLADGGPYPDAVRFQAINSGPQAFSFQHGSTEIASVTSGGTFVLDRGSTGGLVLPVLTEHPTDPIDGLIYVHVSYGPGPLRLYTLQAFLDGEWRSRKLA